MHKTVDLGLVRTPSIPIRMNGVKVTSDSVDVLPGTYAFSTESPQLTLGSKAVMVVKHPKDYASVLDLRVGLSDRRARRPWSAWLGRATAPVCEAGSPGPRAARSAWTNPSAQRYRQGSVRWRQQGADPFRKPNVAVIERSARIGIPLARQHLRSLHLRRGLRHVHRQRDRPRRRLRPAGQGPAGGVVWLT